LFISCALVLLIAGQSEAEMGIEWGAFLPCRWGDFCLWPTLSEQRSDHPSRKRDCDRSRASPGEREALWSLQSRCGGCAFGL